jgi:chitodextrinase
MAIGNRIKETTNSTNTGALALAGAAAGYKSFASGLPASSSGIEVMVGPDSNGAWLIGEYTLSSSGVLTRTAIIDSSNGGQDVTLASGAKDVYNIVSASYLQRMQLDRTVLFSPSVPLSQAGTTRMSATVSGALTFTPAAGAVAGALCWLRLVADGVHVPDFTAFKQWGAGAQYDNRYGILNIIQFFYDGYDYWISFGQQANATPVAIPDTTAPTMSGSLSWSNITTTGFTLNWSAASDNIAVTGYEYSINGGSSFTSVGNALSVAVSGGSPNTTYQTQVRAYDAANNKSAPLSLNVTTLASATAPGAPTVGIAVAGDGYVDVAFTAPSTNGGSTITGYTATLSTGESATGTSSPIRVNATNGTARTAHVTATNGVGTGAASAESNSVTPVAPLRFTSLAAMSESASAPYTYAGVGTNSDFRYVVGGIATKAAPAGAASSMAVTLGNYNTSGGVPANELIFGIQTGSSVVAWQSLPCAIFVESSSATYAPMTSGTIGNSTGVAPANGDIIRFRILRDGSNTVIVEVARAATPTAFTTLYTWTGVSAAKLYFQASLSNLVQVSNLTGVALA